MCVNLGVSNQQNIAVVICERPQEGTKTEKPGSTVDYKIFWYRKLRRLSNFKAQILQQIPNETLEKPHFTAVDPKIVY